jgi:O-antigen ligase
VFALLVAVLALAAVPYGSVDPWWEGAVEASVFGLGALWMLEGALGGRWLAAEHRMLAPLVALCAFAWLQAAPFGTQEVAGVRVSRALSADPAETVRAALKLSAVALALALMLRYASDARRLRVLAYAVVVVGVLSALFGVVRQAGGVEAARWFPARLGASVNSYAQFFNRNHFAFLAEMALAVVCGLALGARRERVLFYAALALPVWAALVLSNSRAGILSMLVLLFAAAFLYLAYVRRRIERREGRGRWWERAADSKLTSAAAVGALFVAVLAGVAWVGGERLAARLEAAPVELSGEPRVRWGDRRTEIWAAGARVLREHPLAGAGFGAFRAAVTAHHDASGEMSLEQAHNDYLELAASGGLVGVVLCVWFAALLVRRAWARLRGRGLARRALAAGALAGLSAVALHSLFDFGLHITSNALTFAALAALAAKDVKDKQEVRT